jgi:hypothetical protein
MNLLMKKIKSFGIVFVILSIPLFLGESSLVLAFNDLVPDADLHDIRLDTKGLGQSTICHGARSTDNDARLASLIRDSENSLQMQNREIQGSQ